MGDAHGRTEFVADGESVHPGLFECTHLRGWLAASCTSQRPSFIVTRHVLERYCRSRNHRNCPFYPGNSSQRNLDA